jgi:hypothetical protein
MQVRKDKYKDNPILPEVLDSVEEDELHQIQLDEELDVQNKALQSPKPPSSWLKFPHRRSLLFRMLIYHDLHQNWTVGERVDQTFLFINDHHLSHCC